MATPEEHYHAAYIYSEQVAQGFVQAQEEGGKIMAGEILMLAQLHVAMGQLKLELDRPGRGLVLPPNHR